jgi:magnesium-transporting ATPase (P-type)
MGNALAIRSEQDSFFRLGLLSNKPFLGAILLTLVLQLAVVYIPAEHFQGSASAAGRSGSQFGHEYTGLLGH